MKRTPERPFTEDDPIALAGMWMESAARQERERTIDEAVRRMAPVTYWAYWVSDCQMNGDMQRISTGEWAHVDETFQDAVRAEFNRIAQEQAGAV